MCEDKAVSMLEQFGYGVILLPSAGIAPLQVYATRQRGGVLLGHVSRLMTGPVGQSPAVELGLEAPTISGQESADFSANAGVSILERLLAGFGLKGLGLQAKFARDLKLRFRFEEVRKDRVEAAVLSDFLKDAEADLGNLLLAEYSRPKAAVVLTETLRSKKFTVVTERSNGTKVDVNLAGIQGVVDVAAGVNVTSSRTGELNFEGSTPLVFGYKGLKFWVEVRNGKGTFRLAVPTGPGGALALPDGSAEGLEEAPLGSGLIRFDLRGLLGEATVDGVNADPGESVRLSVDQNLALSAPAAGAMGGGAALGAVEPEPSTPEIAFPADYEQIGGGGAAALSVPAPAKHAVIVAEGDSWFDYPIKGDLLDALRKEHGYTIYELSKAGAMIEDMVYGADREFLGSVTPQIVNLVQAIRRRRPSVVLISGGGNDIAGDELAALINRKAPGVPVLRAGAVDALINEVFTRCYRVFIDTVLRAAEEAGIRNLVVVGHNYDFVTADGRGYSITGWIPGFSYVGPWLRPAFARKGYSQQEADKAIGDMMLRFTDTLRRLEQEYSSSGVRRFVMVDLQGTLNPLSRDDWDNEMHPTWSGFCRLAQKVHSRIQQIP
jgi:hypothetical protein